MKHPGVLGAGPRNGDLGAAVVASSAEPSRITALDGVRGVAIFLILFVHAAPHLQPWLGDSVYWSDLGLTGVDLFFVLSGFLITKNLLRDRGTPGYFQRFYGRRFLRLFPLYYAYLLLVAFIIPLIHRLAGTTMWDYQGPWWWYVAYLCNWKSADPVSDPYLWHFWSLAVEEQFYLVWPIVIWRLSKRNAALTCFALFALSLGLRSTVFESVDWRTPYRFTITRLDPLAAGALVALALNYPVWKLRLAKFAPWLTVLGLFGYLAVSAVSAGPRWDRPLIRTIGPSLVATGFAGLVAWVLLHPSWIQKPFSRPLPVALGKYSYCIYVIHCQIQMDGCKTGILRPRASECATDYKPRR